MNKHLASFLKNPLLKIAQLLNYINNSFLIMIALFVIINIMFFKFQTELDLLEPPLSYVFILVIVPPFWFLLKGIMTYPFRKYTEKKISYTLNTLKVGPSRRMRMSFTGIMGWPPSFGAQLQDTDTAKDTGRVLLIMVTYVTRQLKYWKKETVVDVYFPCHPKYTVYIEVPQSSTDNAPIVGAGSMFRGHFCTMQELQSSMKKIFLATISIACILLAVLGYYGYHAFQKTLTARQNQAYARASLSWPAVEATILSRQFVTLGRNFIGNSGVYEVILKYQYIVDNAIYSGNRIFFGYQPTKMRIPHETIAKRYYPGARVFVLYDPKNPDLATLEFGHEDWSKTEFQEQRLCFLKLTGGFILTFVVAVLFLLLNWRHRIKLYAILQSNGGLGAQPPPGRRLFQAS